MTYLVLGITGHVGGAAAQQLLDAGQSVRAVARDTEKAAEWTQKGVDVREGNWNDAGVLADALRGVDGAFIMVPPTYTQGPDFEQSKAIIASFVKALHIAPPPRLVVLSSVGSEKSSGLGLITTTHLLEEAVKEMPFPVAFVRAGSFLENYLPAFAPSVESGVFHSLWTPTSRAFPVIAAGDIGREVVRRLTGAAWNGLKISELGSLASPDDLARAMSDASGTPVVAQAVPREKWTAMLHAQGFPEPVIGPYSEMIEGFNSGWIAFGVPDAEPVAATIMPPAFFAQTKP